MAQVYEVGNPWFKSRTGPSFFLLFFFHVILTFFLLFDIFFNQSFLLLLIPPPLLSPLFMLTLFILTMQTNPTIVLILFVLYSSNFQALIGVTLTGLVMKKFGERLITPPEDWV